MAHIPSCSRGTYPTIIKMYRPNTFLLCSAVNVASFFVVAAPKQQMVLSIYRLLSAGPNRALLAISSPQSSSTVLNNAAWLGI